MEKRESGSVVHLLNCLPPCQLVAATTSCAGDNNRWGHHGASFDRTDCRSASGGCAHKLPIDDAVAFRTLATANRDSFRALAKSANESLITFVSRRLQEGAGEVSYVGCKLAPIGDEAKQACTVVWTPKLGKGLELRPTAPATRALIGALADYGDQMATLAEAKDVTQA